MRNICSMNDVTVLLSDARHERRWPTSGGLDLLTPRRGRVDRVDDQAVRRLRRSAMTLCSRHTSSVSFWTTSSSRLADVGVGGAAPGTPSRRHGASSLRPTLLRLIAYSLNLNRSLFESSSSCASCSAVDVARLDERLACGYALVLRRSGRAWTPLGRWRRRRSVRVRRRRRFLRPSAMSVCPFCVLWSSCRWVVLQVSIGSAAAVRS